MLYRDRFKYPRATGGTQTPTQDSSISTILTEAASASLCQSKPPRHERISETSNEAAYDPGTLLDCILPNETNRYICRRPQAAFGDSLLLEFVDVSCSFFWP
jgi:hypothetical protein